MALSTGQYDGIRGIKEAKNSHRQSCHSTVEYDISFVCNKHVPGRGGGSSKAHEEVKKSKAMTYVSKNPLDFPVQESRLEANVMNKLFPRILPLLIAFTVAVRLAPAAHAQTTTPAEQAVLHGYQKAPQPISDILSAAPTPLVLVSPKANQLLVVDRLANPPVADLAQPMLRLAGGCLHRQDAQGYRASRQAIHERAGMVAYGRTIRFQQHNRRRDRALDRPVRERRGPSNSGNKDQRHSGRCFPVDAGRPHPAGGSRSVSA